MNNDDNDNVSKYDDNDKKAKKVITSRKWILNSGHTSKSHSGQVANKTVTIGNADKQGRQHYHFLYPYNVSLILTRLEIDINVEKGY